MVFSQAARKITDQLNSGSTTGLAFGRTTWRLLERSGNKVLLLSENLVDHAPFDRSPGEKHVSWEQSHLRKHMSRDLPAMLFSDEEYKCVATTNTATTTNPLYGARDSGAADKLFPLSIEEVDKYLCEGNTLRKFHQGTIDLGIFGNCISDAYNDARIARLPGTNVDWWWLRTPGEKSQFSPLMNNMALFNQCYIGNKGSINMHGSNYDDRWGGIRPAMWLNL